MKLDFAMLDIKGMEWGERTEAVGGVLYVNRDEALGACGAYPGVEAFSLHIARPGESVRILPVKMVVEPRCKTSEEGAMFPGIFGDVDGMKQAGIGRTLALKGAAVVVTESGDDELVCRTGGFVDMSGPASEYTPYSKTFNMIVNARVNIQMQKNETQAVDDACRLAGLRLAVYLAEQCAGAAPDRAVTRELAEADPSLPGVVYVMQLLAQNPLVEDFRVYGQIAGPTMIPTVLHPNEVLDGAVTNFIGSHCTVCSDKQYLYDIQNSPAIEECFERHGKTLRFLGVVLHNEVVTLSGKIRSSLVTTKLAKMLGADGAILCTEGHGNPDEDIMLNVKHLEDAGIGTVVISDELGGVDGSSPGLADWVPECDAMVSVGNTHQLLAVPEKMGAFIGNEASMAIIRVDCDERPEPEYFYTQLNHVASACSQGGIGRLSARWV